MGTELFFLRQESSRTSKILDALFDYMMPKEVLGIFIMHNKKQRQNSYHSTR